MTLAPVVLIPLIILTMAATVLAQQWEPPPANDPPQPSLRRFILLPSAADLMDSLWQTEVLDRQAHLEDFRKRSQRAMLLYQRALHRYLYELPWVETDKGTQHVWWNDFAKQQERFWRMWRAKFSELFDHHLQAIWTDSYRHRLEQTIPISRSCPLFLTHEFGDVVIHGSPKEAAHLMAEIEVIAATEADAGQYAREIGFEVVPQDSVLKVITLLPALRPKTVEGISIALALELPRECHLRVANSFGDVRVSGLLNGLRARTSHGCIEVQQCAGHLDLSNRQGEIVVTKGNGDLNVETSFGSIVVSQVQGNVFAINKFGLVSVKGICGAVHVENSAGPIEITDIDGDVSVNNHLGRVMVHGVKGNLTVDNAGSPVSIADVLGETHIESKKGEIRAEKLGGDVVILSQNGDVDLVLDEIRQNLYRLDTSYGVIRVNLPSRPSARICAEALYGTIDSDFPLEIKRVGSSQSARGKLGKGIANIQLDGKNSNIYLISSER